MSEECLCKAENTVLLPCSGGSNCGQIANNVAVSLDSLGLGRIYCLAGIGAHIPGMVESAKGAERIVVIDGCQVACARKTVEHAGLKASIWICVTEEGITKNHNLMLEQGDIELITQITKKRMTGPANEKVQKTV
jgi:uncharacterized metal-binding protein